LSQGKVVTSGTNTSGTFVAPTSAPNAITDQEWTFILGNISVNANVGTLTFTLSEKTSDATGGSLVTANPQPIDVTKTATTYEISKFFVFETADADLPISPHRSLEAVEGGVRGNHRDTTGNPDCLHALPDCN